MPIMGFHYLISKYIVKNMITNDDFINHHQKGHRDYQVTFLKTIIESKKSNN